MATYDALSAETKMIAGANGDLIAAYVAQPLGEGPFPGVIALHSAPGMTEGSKLAAIRFASHGYITVMPHLHYRESLTASDTFDWPAPWGEPKDPAAAAVVAAGGVPDERFLGDFQGAQRYLSTFPNWNGKVGTIGQCSGGRQSYLVGCKTKIDAVVTSSGGDIVAGPEKLNERYPVAPIDLTKDMSAPVLGLFGATDRNPTLDDVAKIEAKLKECGKEYEFQIYEDAGHAYFSAERHSYHNEAARDSWLRVLEFFGKHLKGENAS